MTMTGLVLEGGAMRGLFTAGVLDMLLEADIRFDGAIGVSAGAAFGCNFKSRQSGRVIRYNTRYSRDWRYCSFRSMLLTGDLFGAKFCYRDLPNKLDPFDNETFNRNPMSFWVVVTDVETGLPHYRRVDRAGDECSDWIRASASMPLVSRVVELEGRGYLDGGIADSIPLRAFEERGFERNVVILTQPEGFVKVPSSGLGLMRLMLRKYPKMVDTLANRHVNYNEAVAYVKQREKEGAALVIRPKEKLDIGRVEHDPDKMRAVYELGREAGREKLNEIRAFLA
ncbi:MAG: patatin family protein [Clostridia bacterium]|nr:patatin family protein [Clostridia bacterium]